jgi:hypothetical protein
MVKESFSLLPELDAWPKNVLIMDGVQAHCEYTFSRITYYIILKKLDLNPNTVYFDQLNELGCEIFSQAIF